MSSRKVHPVTLLNELLSRAIVDVLGKEHEGADPVIRPAKSPELGDFQVNAAMALGKRIGTPPRDLAEKLVEAADLQAIAENVDVAGPGFINIRLKDHVLADALGGMSGADLGVCPR